MPGKKKPAEEGQINSSTGQSSLVDNFDKEEFKSAWYKWLIDEKVDVEQLPTNSEMAKSVILKLAETHENYMNIDVSTIKSTNPIFKQMTNMMHHSRKDQAKFKASLQPGAIADDSSS